MSQLESDQPDLNLTFSEATPTPKLSRWKIAQSVLALLMAVTITVGITLLSDRIEEFAVYGYPGVFLISVIGNATIILPAPSFAIAFAAGSVLNPYIVGIVAGFGAAIGESTGYLAGFAGRGVLENKPLYHKLAGLMARRGAWVIFALGLIPNPIFDVGGIIAGALKMPWWKFVLAAAAGKSLRFIGLAFLGAWILPMLGA